MSVSRLVYCAAKAIKLIESVDCLGLLPTAPSLTSTTTADETLHSPANLCEVNSLRMVSRTVSPSKGFPDATFPVSSFHLVRAIIPATDHEYGPSRGYWSQAKV